MFDRIHSSTESNDTLFNPGSTGDADPGFAAPLPDRCGPAKGRERPDPFAAVGMPAHAIREVLGSRTLYRCGRLNRGRGGLEVRREV